MARGVFALALALVAVTAAAAPPAPSAGDIEALLRKGDVGAALSAATTATRARPTDVELGELYVDLLASTGNGARALAEMQALAAASPQSPDARYLVGRATPDAAASKAAYESALALAPDHARARMGVGSVLEATGALGPAEAAYGAAVARDPSLSEAWIGRIRVLVALGRVADALTQARAAWKAVPGDAGVGLALAALSPKEAGAVLALALARTPDDPRLHEALAAERLAAGDAAGALNEARAALAVDPTALDAGRIELVAREVTEGRLDDAGRVAVEAARRRELVDPQGALVAYRALVERYPGSSIVRQRVGTLRRVGGDRAGIEDLVAAAALDPSSAEAAGAAGLALVEDGRMAEADVWLARAAEARPWDPNLRLGRVRALAVLGRKEEAHAMAAQLVRTFPTDPSVLVTHAGFLLDEGRTEEAYLVVRAGLVAVPDPKLAAAFVRIAPLAGHPEEAASLLDQIVATTGNQALADAARKLRSQAAGADR